MTMMKMDSNGLLFHIGQDFSTLMDELQGAKNSAVHRAHKLFVFIEILGKSD